MREGVDANEDRAPGPRTSAATRPPRRTPVQQSSTPRPPRRAPRQGEGKELLITMGLLLPGGGLVLGGIVAIKSANAVAAGLTAMAFGVFLLGMSLLRSYRRDYGYRGLRHPVVVFLFVTFVPAVCGVLLTRLLLGG